MKIYTLYRKDKTEPLYIFVFQRFNPTLKETLCKSVLHGSKKKMNMNISTLYWIDMTEPLYIFVFQRFNPTLKETLCKSVLQGSEKK